MNIINEPSSSPVTEPENGSKDKAEASIKELDWSGETIYSLQEKCTELIKTGFVLHGSTQGELEMLEPHESYDIFKDNGKTTAVFATDQPLIALVHGSAGSRLQSWTKRVFFVVDNRDDLLPEYGYVYALPTAEFVHDLYGNSAEYLSAKSVRPAMRIKFKTVQILPLLRTPKEFDEAIDPETEIIKSDSVRQSDIDIALLTLRNMLQLTGRIDYQTTDSSKGLEYFSRLPLIVRNLEPVLKRIESLATPLQKELACEVYKLYYDSTYSIYEAPPLAQDFDRLIGPILSKLSKLKN